MTSAGSDIHESFRLAQQAIELMRSHGSSATPRSYEVWFTYASGEKPLMNQAIKALAASRGTVTDRDIEVLHEQHLGATGIAQMAEQAGQKMIGEIDQVVELIGAIAGSTARYGESLEALTEGLANTDERARVREVLESLVSATQDVASTNRQLDARLKDSRNEIETLRETLEAARLDALTDPLTGIANRKHFEEMLIKSIDNATVQRSPLALIVIDIDHFKRFNDTYGHITGDQVLRLVSATMRKHVSSRATIARFGGEEFGVILPVTALDAAQEVGETIRRNVMSRELVKRSTGESLGRVTISVGIAAFRKGDTAVSLLHRADQCMFAAKRSGRNRTFLESAGAERGGIPNAA